MSLRTLLAYVVIAASAALIVRESRARASQYLAIATLAIGVLEVLHSRGRLIRYIARLQEAGTALALATLLLGLVLYVRARDRTFPLLLVVCGALLLLVDMDVLTRL